MTRNANRAEAARQLAGMLTNTNFEYIVRNMNIIVGLDYGDKCAFSLVSNTSNVLNKRNIGPLGQKLIKITHLISVTEDQFSVFE